MNIPVANWRTDVGNTPVFWDLMDRDLRLYGPRPIWRPLERQLLGPVMLISGVCTFDYTPKELAELSKQLPGKKLAPLIYNGMIPELTSVVTIGLPHTYKIVTTPSVPFPEVRFSCTLQTAASGAQALADDILQHWNTATLLRGSIAFDYDMRVASCGHEVTVDYRACADWLHQQPGTGRGLTTALAAALVERYVAINDGASIRFVGVTEDADERKLVRQRLAEVLLKGTTIDSGSFITFDNGEKLMRLAVHPANQLSDARSQLYIHTADARERLNYTFP